MEYHLIRSRRKTLCLSIAPDLSVVVKAPTGLPQAEIEQFVQRHAAWIQSALARQTKRNALSQSLTPERIDALRAQAQTEIGARVERFSKIMGVVPTGVRITGAKTRFGSCSASNSLCFSWRLMLYPPQAIDYVVVHELAHIRQKNHGSAFYQEVAAVLPDYKQRAKLLKEIPTQEEHTL